jgi:hypothetical protein
MEEIHKPGTAFPLELIYPQVEKMIDPSLMDAAGECWLYDKCTYFNVRVDFFGYVTTTAIQRMFCVNNNLEGTK